jgi:hypothetical protein
MKDVLCVYDPDWAGIKFKVSWDHKSQVHFVRGSNGRLTPHCQQCLEFLNSSYAVFVPEGTYEEYVVERVMYS